jgi:hypothetical protein
VSVALKQKNAIQRKRSSLPRHFGLSISFN